MNTANITKRLILTLLFSTLPALALADVQSGQLSEQQADKNNFALSNASLSAQQATTKTAVSERTAALKPGSSKRTITPRGKLLSTKYNQRSSYTRYRDDENNDGAGCLYSQNTMTYSCP